MRLPGALRGSLSLRLPPLVRVGVSLGKEIRQPQAECCTDILQAAPAKVMKQNPSIVPFADGE